MATLQTSQILPRVRPLALRVGVALSAMTLALAAAGCDDPSKGKTKAAAVDPIATTTSQSAPANGAATQGVKQTFDQGSSKIDWTGSKVTAKHDGSFGRFKGTVDLVDGAPEKSKVDVEIETASLTTEPDKLVTHLKGSDFFDVEKFPKATFVSTSVTKGVKGDEKGTHTVVGNLTLKGTTKGISFPATVKASGDETSVDAEFSINRRDFSLNYPGMPNDLIRDNVVIKLTIRAKK